MGVVQHPNEAKEDNPIEFIHGATKVQEENELIDHTAMLNERHFGIFGRSLF